MAEAAARGGSAAGCEGPGGDGMPVAVCVATEPGRAVEIALAAKVGMRVRDVLNDPAVRPLLRDARTPEGIEPDVGIWGRRCPLDRQVRAGDRVEVYRPLRVDPMTARRERFRKQGARATGLFASRTKRPG